MNARTNQLVSAYKKAVLFAKTAFFTRLSILILFPAGNELIPVMIRLERSLKRHTNIIGLFLG
jgi:hypothetical protein